MSDNIPFEIQVEIVKRLPVKSLIQFRSVSTTWKSLIDSSSFIAEYARQYRETQHILFRYRDYHPDNELKFVSIVDDDTFPRKRVSLTYPVLVQMFEYHSIIGCSFGLFCFYCHDQADGDDDPIFGTAMAVLWNPSIRKAVDVVVPNVANGNTYETVLGFGVCRETSDPKIVKITYIVRWDDIESASHIPCQVEVYTLSTGAWRSLSGNLPRKVIRFDFCPLSDCYSVVMDGVLYWLATDRITFDSRSWNLIISFDMTNEEFGEVNLPNGLAPPLDGHYLIVSKLRESLVVLEGVEEANRIVYNVWMLEGDVSKSFTK
ncbi:putative F-box domain-containing protein [Helianthus annuus]|nr:putative F-box domain-containing protein [Helianthus annuus]KAJ0633844.1 putative F-box domain-containing protein [Helianthus annuus]